MENKMKALTNKKVIVLGGSTGIGFATAKAAADEGAHVVIVSSNQQKIDAALKELPDSSTGYPVDLSKEADIKRFFETIGTFDHLVFTAGENLTLNTISSTEIAHAQQFLNVRFWGAFAAVKYASPYINKGGSINLISGIASTRPGKGWSVASSICGAIEGFVRALAVELAPIRVNCVTPGIIETGMWGSMKDADRENLFNSAADALLLKRIGTAADVALAFLYLMNQQFGTGQSIVVDGGAVLV